MVGSLKVSIVICCSSESLSKMTSQKKLKTDIPLNLDLTLTCAYFQSHIFQRKGKWNNQAIIAIYSLLYLFIVISIIHGCYILLYFLFEGDFDFAR